MTEWRDAELEGANWRDVARERANTIREERARAVVAESRVGHLEEALRECLNYMGVDLDDEATSLARCVITARALLVSVAAEKQETDG